MSWRAALAAAVLILAYGMASEADYREAHGLPPLFLIEGVASK